MPSLLDSITNTTTVIVEIIPFNDPVLYFSTNNVTITKDGTYMDVYPYITGTIDLTLNVVTPFDDGDLKKGHTINGFKLTYNIGVTFEIPKYYGAKVNCYIGTSNMTDFSSFGRFYSGFIANVNLTEKQTIVTLDTGELQLKKDLLRTISDRVVPVAIGTGTNFGAVPVKYNNETYHVVSFAPFTINNVYNMAGDNIPYTLNVIDGITVVKPSVPTDSTLRIDGSAGSGAIGDLLKFLLNIFGFNTHQPDIDTINTIFPENVNLQLFQQFTLSDMLTYILRAINHVWFYDSINDVVRITPFARTTPTFTITDNHIVSTSVSMVYRTRPFTHFKAGYALNFSNSTLKEITRVHPNASLLDASLHKIYPTIYFLTYNDVTANQYLDYVYNLYSGGLGVLTIDVNILAAADVHLGDTILIDSDYLNLHDIHFYVEEISYKLSTYTIGLKLITI